MTKGFTNPAAGRLVQPITPRPTPQPKPADTLGRMVGSAVRTPPRPGGAR